MQLGFLRSERPPEVRSYLPSFRLGKWVSRSAERASGLCPETPPTFWKKLDQKLYSSLRCALFHRFYNQTIVTVFHRDGEADFF